jgi:hypothetical protein
MASVANPTEAVLANQITPRVGFHFKQNSEFDFEVSFEPNL